MRVTGQIWRFIDGCVQDGQTLIGLRGPRRASKTWTTCQYLLNQIFSAGDEVIFASMTEMQGDAGIYADAKRIIASNPAWYPAFNVTKSPRRIENKYDRDGRTGWGMFRSFKDPETAKGGACDWVFMNEANKFNLQQYYDLSANARKGVIIDFNPNEKFWGTDLLTERNELKVKWTWNKPNLTPAQIKWFADVTARAFAPGHTSADEYFYRVYVLGEYAEIDGEIFTRANIRREQVDLQGMVNYFVYADPSAMCGSDYFAMVLAAFRDGIMYIVDTWSRNVGGRADAAEAIEDWCKNYDVQAIFVEGNGIIGKTFYEEQRASLPGMRPYTNTENKHGRILGNYEDICSRIVFVENDHLEPFLAQVYEYEGKNSLKTHDDNIDAVNSAYEIMKRRFRAF